MIGGLISLSAIAKALDLSGFAEVLGTYQAFPGPLLFPLATVILLVELGLGGWILTGYRLRESAKIAALLNVVYACWMLLTLLRGLTLSNCGCFGVFFPRPLTWISPIEDLVFAGLCLLLCYLAPSRDSKPSITSSQEA